MKTMTIDQYTMHARLHIEAFIVHIQERVIDGDLPSEMSAAEWNEEAEAWFAARAVESRLDVENDRRSLVERRSIKTSHRSHR